MLLADAFAAACDLDYPAHKKLLYSAMFHDIGKIGIPDTILMHHGPLDPAQRTVMEKHSVIGESIVGLMRIKDGDEIACYVRHHHEHFDGGGYPDGLRGYGIPLLARMLTILDCYDAMREIRPYREALSHKDAIGIMQKETGTIHDPELLKRFVAMEKIEDIGEKYNEKKEE